MPRKAHRRYKTGLKGHHKVMKSESGREKPE